MKLSMLASPSCRAGIVASFLAVGALGAQEPRSKPELLREEVEFRSGDVQLAATLLLATGKGRAPGVVVVHGSGESDRSNPWTAAWAEALALRGIAVLHPDKRGCGRSKGDWKSASFAALAEDAAAGVAWMRQRPEIDPAQVGVIGFSQGVDIAPVCAANAGACDFVVAVSGSVVPLCEQIVDEIELGAAQSGKPITAAQREQVDAAHRLALRCAVEGKGWDELREHVRAGIARDSTLAPALAGLQAGEDHWISGWIRAVGDFDPAPYWKRVAVPMLFVYGGRDTQVNVDKSTARLRELLDVSKQNWAVLEFAQNGHALIRDDLLDFSVRWIRDRGAK